MDNYYYIIAGLPALSRDWKYGETDFSSIIGEIKDGCTEKDREIIGLLEQGFDDGCLDREFYVRTQASGNRFIREYFAFDLNVRNAKTRFLNNALGRDADKDIICTEDGEDTVRTAGVFGDIAEPDGFDEAARLDAILHGNDILARERGIDDLMWEKIDSLTVFSYFDINTILGFICKLHILDRWARLDEQTGREMFRKLVDEIMGTFNGNNNKINNE